MSAFDLPQMWEQPPFETLLACLEGLKLQPPIWNHDARRDDIIAEQEASFTDRREVARYLSTIIKSPLEWIPDDSRDQLWELASRRMSERSGRAGMGEVTRCWPFNLGKTPFSLAIKEPAITGDSLGFKTWGSSYLLALQLPALSSTSLFRLFDESLGKPRPPVLELGSGTGLLGLAAAAIWRVRVTMSDLPSVVPNLAANAAANAKVLGERGVSVDVGALTWGGGAEGVDQRLFGSPNQFKVVLVADPLYDDNHPELLHDAISTQLALGPDARAVVMVPKRDSVTEGLLESFLGFMAGGEAPIDCLEHGELGNQDDWEADGEEVKCWWGVFGRRVS